MFSPSAIAFGALCALTEIRASPAPSSPPTPSLAARACEGTEPYVRLNAADWTQIVKVIPQRPGADGGWQRFGGMGPPNSTIDMLFKDNYKAESFLLNTFKEAEPIKPGGITWLTAIQALQAGAESEKIFVPDLLFNVSAMHSGERGVRLNAVHHRGAEWHP